MQRRQTLGRLLPVLCLGVTLYAPSARAQVGPGQAPSHVPLREATLANPAEMLASIQLRRNPQLSQLGDQRKLLEKIFGNLEAFGGHEQTAQRIQDALKGKEPGLDRNNPLIREALEEVLKHTPEADQAKLRDHERDLLNSVVKELSKPGAIKPESSPSPSAPPPSTATAKEQDPLAPNSPQASEDDDTRELAQMLQRMVENLQSKAALRDSPALQQALRDLTRYTTSMAGVMPRVNSAIRFDDTMWTRLSRSLPWDRLRAEARKLTKLNVRLPSLPHVPLPSAGLPISVGPISGLNPSSWGGSLKGTLQTDNSMVEIVLVTSLLIAIGWLVLHSRRNAKIGAKERLGAWPVPPSLVATRAQLVQAFEYLSLLRLGPRARSLNHREIAAGLGADVEERRHAATDLAALYEQVRYAPGDEPLTEDALAAARRDLCFLAGVSAA